MRGLLAYLLPPRGEKREEEVEIDSDTLSITHRRCGRMSVYSGRREVQLCIHCQLWVEPRDYKLND